VPAVPLGGAARRHRLQLLISFRERLRQRFGRGAHPLERSDELCAQIVVLCRLAAVHGIHLVAWPLASRRITNRAAHARALLSGAPRASCMRRDQSMLRGMRTLSSTSCALWIVIALAACGEMGKAVDKLEQMDKEMAGESDTPPTPPTTVAPEPVAPTVPDPAAPAAPEPAAPAPAPTEVAQPEPAPTPAAAPKPKQPAPPTTSAKTPTEKTETKPKPVPEPAKPEPVKQEPKAEPVKAEPAAAPAPAPAKAKTAIPQSKHVRIDAPKRVQELLDLDGRMQPWLNNTMKVIEQCYADVRKDDAKAAGTIVFVLEMHKNSRPDADISSLPPALSGIVACATGKLMRAARMPLFTGNEGEKHTVRVKFTP
jgi:hypothetical protein